MREDIRGVGEEKRRGARRDEEVEGKQEGVRMGGREGDLLEREE